MDSELEQAWDDVADSLHRFRLSLGVLKGVLKFTIELAESDAAVMPADYKGMFEAEYSRLVRDANARMARFQFKCYSAAKSPNAGK